MSSFSAIKAAMRDSGAVWGGARRASVSTSSQPNNLEVLKKKGFCTRVGLDLLRMYGAFIQCERDEGSVKLVSRMFAEMVHQFLEKNEELSGDASIALGVLRFLRKFIDGVEEFLSEESAETSANQENEEGVCATETANQEAIEGGEGEETEFESLKEQNLGRDNETRRGDDLEGEKVEARLPDVDADLLFEITNEDLMGAQRRAAIDVKSIGDALRSDPTTTTMSELKRIPLPLQQAPSKTFPLLEEHETEINLDL
eukprot:GDKK01058476.1.p1 GENE.GDKK01058476.1~~GDKK01058476.1.p1  ORF type:complete len:274 (-),score=69.02 GDKK01058476.1:84-854(-)